MSEKAAIILAAGLGTRMKSEMPKVLHEVCGRPMLEYVVEACRHSGVSKIIVVVGYNKHMVIDCFAGQKDLIFVEQAEQNGTGHAVMCCIEELKKLKVSDVLILCGDTPMIQGDMITDLIEKHDGSGAAVTMSTAYLDDPSGYGRIDRDQHGRILGIVEHNDCDQAQLEINEINPGYYCFKNDILLEMLGRIKPNNVKNEYYLTDALHLAISDGHKVEAVSGVDPVNARGVNSREQLAEISKLIQKRVNSKWLSEGVTIVDPDTTWIDERVEIGNDTTIEPFVYIFGKIKIGAGCRIGSHVSIRNTNEIKDGSKIEPGTVI